MLPSATFYYCIRPLPTIKSRIVSFLALCSSIEPVASTEKGAACAVAGAVCILELSTLFIGLPDRSASQFI
jgi:hypothetical protein